MKSKRIAKASWTAVEMTVPICVSILAFALSRVPVAPSRSHLPGRECHRFVSQGGPGAGWDRLSATEPGPARNNAN
jgi:hypothetical protein